MYISTCIQSNSPDITILICVPIIPRSENVSEDLQGFQCSTWFTLSDHSFILQFIDEHINNMNNISPVTGLEHEL